MEERPVRPPRKFKSPLQRAKTRARIGLLVWFLISIAAIIVGAILIGSTEYLGPALLLFGVLAFILNFVDHAQKMKKIKMSHCRECGARLGYGQDIGWEVEEVETTSSKQIAYIHVECSCPECDNVDEYDLKVPFAYWDKNRQCFREKNIETLVRKYFLK